MIYQCMLKETPTETLIGMTKIGRTRTALPLRTKVYRGGSTNEAISNLLRDIDTFELEFILIVTSDCKHQLKRAISTVISENQDIKINDLNIATEQYPDDFTSGSFSHTNMTNILQELQKLKMEEVSDK